MKYIKASAGLVAVSLLVGCYSNTDSVLDTKSSQVATRSYQSRAFDTSDRNRAMRAVIATLQDLDFVLDKADDSLGTVSATKFTANQPLKMTVSIRPRGSDQIQVRANAQYNVRAVEDPKAYQDFFTSLSKSLFLDAQEIG